MEFSLLMTSCPLQTLCARREQLDMSTSAAEEVCTVLRPSLFWVFHHAVVDISVYFTACMTVSLFANLPRNDLFVFLFLSLIMKPQVGKVTMIFDDSDYNMGVNVLL